MKVEDAEKMFTGITDWDRCVVLFPVGDQVGCRWIGMSMGDCAAFLSKAAAEIVTKHLPTSSRTN